MPTILVTGSGHIGSAIGQILTQPGNDYLVILSDLSPEPPNHFLKNPNLEYIQLDVRNQPAIAEMINKYQVKTIISSLPYFLNTAVAEVAQSLQVHYFDLTEDTQTTASIAKLAKSSQSVLMPQCGVAPGFINIVAHDLMQHFRELSSVKLRCGALPQQVNNSLQYALTWSIDGLINEYGNPCTAINNGQLVSLPPLSDLEIVQLEGSRYEAFNTSGGGWYFG